MKKMIKFLFAVIIIFLTLQGCGERGPVGPEGPPGPEILPTSFEFSADLVPSNNFEYFRDIPSQINVIGSDMMIAYVLEDYIEGDDLDVWRQLPITDFTDRGTRTFNFDFTRVDIRIFLDANYPLGNTDRFENVLIRAVHIPADFVNSVNAKQLENAQSITEIEQVIGTKVQHITVN